MMGRDHTIFAVEDGMVKFDRSSVRARIMVVPKEEAADAAPAKETARTRKFAKCVAALLACCAAFRARELAAARFRMRLTRPRLRRFPPRNSAAKEEAPVAR